MDKEKTSGIMTRLNNMEIVSQSSEQTRKIGEEFSRKISHGGVVCLYGNLGSGKTTFVQGVARGLSIKQRIVSPTFMIIREYKILKNNYCSSHAQRSENFSAAASKNIIDVYHLDLYRINSLDDVKNLGMEEILADNTNIVFIEWPEKIKKILPKKRIEIYFEYLKESERKIKILDKPE